MTSCSCTLMESALISVEGMGGDKNYKGHSRTSCSCTVMLITLISLKWIGGDVRVIVGHHVAVL